MKNVCRNGFRPIVKLSNGRGQPTEPDALMAFTTSISKSYALWMIIFAIVFVVLGLWGLYDLTVSIPNEQIRYDRFVQVQEEIADLEQRVAAGETMTTEEKNEYAALEEEMTVLAAGGENPVPPGKFDKFIQWLYILCLPSVPYMVMQLVRAKRGGYRLEDDGTLHYPSGKWSQDDIAGIDMSSWMKKSTAEVIHQDGSRAKLDDYIHTNTHLIVGAIAHRFHPDEWDEQARMIKKKEDTTPSDSASDSSEAPEAPETQTSASADDSSPV